MTPPRPWLAGLFVFASAFAVYSNSLDNALVWDDHVQIESNSFLQDARNARRIVSPSFFGRVVPARGGGRPLVLLSLLADRQVWGMTPEGFRWTNVLLHAGASSAFYALALALIEPFPALVAALIFAAHPIHTEAVDIASFRGDLWAALFVFLGLWSYARLSDRAGRWRLFAALAALQLCYFFGLMAKEMAITLPGLALLFEWVYRRPEGKKRAPHAVSARRGFWTRQAALILVPAALAAWYLVFRAPRAGFPPAFASGLIPSEPQWGILYRDPVANLMTMSWVFVQYFVLMLIPFPLEIDRAPLILQSWSSPWLWTSWLVLGMFGWIAFAAARRRHAAIAFGIGWCFLTLIPVSNLVPIYNVIAERYLYLVSAGACLALAALFDGLPARSGVPAAAALIGAYAFGTIVRNRDFRDDRALFFQGGRRFVQSARLYCNRATLLQREGQPQAAILELIQALAVYPRYAEAKIALGTALESLGLRAQALQSFQEGVALDPRYPLPYFLLGEALRREHRTVEARGAYSRALALDPRFSGAHLGLGLAWAEEKQLPEAVAELERAQAIGPESAATHLILGNLLAELRRWPDAAREFKRTIVLEPRSREAATKLAHCYERMGRRELARRWLERAKVGT